MLLHNELYGQQVKLCATSALKLYNYLSCLKYLYKLRKIFANN